MTDLQKFLKQAAREIVALGKERGFIFTEEEVSRLAGSGDLSDEQLDSVSGGGITTHPGPSPRTPGTRQ